MKYNEIFNRTQRLDLFQGLWIFMLCEKLWQISEHELQKNFKAASKRAIQKMIGATGDLVKNKITEKVV